MQDVQCPECLEAAAFSQRYREAGQKEAVARPSGPLIAPVPGPGSSDQALKTFNRHQSLKPGPAPPMRVAEGAARPRAAASSVYTQQWRLSSIGELDLAGRTGPSDTGHLRSDPGHVTRDQPAPPSALPPPPPNPRPRRPGEHREEYISRLINTSSSWRITPSGFVTREQAEAWYDEAPP